jgi:hypothetical protein
MRYKDLLVEKGLTANDLVKHGDDRLNAFLAKIDRGEDFILTGNQGTVKIDKSEKNKILQAIRSGNTRSLKFNSTEGDPLTLSKLEKTGEFGGTGQSSAGERQMANRGNTVEGVLGAATLARLAARPGRDITAEDVKKVIGIFAKQSPVNPNAKSSGGEVRFTSKEADNITDKFIGTVKLPNKNYVDFLDWEFMMKDKQMSGFIRNIIAYVNEAGIVGRFAKFFETNGRPDEVKVIADGVSDMSGRKTDIEMHYIDENGKRQIKKFDLSLKAGTTSQFGQVSAGSPKEGSSKYAFSRYGFDMFKTIFGDFGVDISSMENEFLGSANLQEGVTKVYQRAVEKFQEQLAGSDDDAEKKWLRTFVDNLKRHGTLNDPAVQLLQFEANKYFVLDFQKLDRLLSRDKLDLEVKGTVSKPRDGGPGWPSVVFYNKLDPKEELVRIRAKVDPDKVNNLIEKGTLFKKITKVRGN